MASAALFLAQTNLEYATQTDTASSEILDGVGTSIVLVIQWGWVYTDC